MKKNQEEHLGSALGEGMEGGNDIIPLKSQKIKNSLIQYRKNEKCD